MVVLISHPNNIVISAWRRTILKRKKTRNSLGLVSFVRSFFLFLLLLRLLLWAHAFTTAQLVCIYLTDVADVLVLFFTRTNELNFNLLPSFSRRRSLILSKRFYWAPFALLCIRHAIVSHMVFISTWYFCWLAKWILWIRTWKRRQQKKARAAIKPQTKSNEINKFAPGCKAIPEYWPASAAKVKWINR